MTTVAPAPHAVCIGGAAGSGKTTLAAALAPALHAALIDLDVVTGPLTSLVLELIGATDLSEPGAAGLTRGPRYETLLDLVEETLRVGLPVVAVAPFTAERHALGWEALTARLRPLGVARLVWLTVPGPELAARLTARGAARDSLKLRDPAGFAAGLEPVPPTAPHLALDGTRPVADLVRDVLAYCGS